MLSRKTSLPLAIAVIFITGVLAGYWRYRQERTTLLAQLVVTARRCAMAFDPKELAQLTGDATDTTKPALLAVRQRLIRLRRVAPDIRSIYLVRCVRATGATVTLADSEPATSVRTPEKAIVHDAANQPALQRVVSTGQPAAEGPLQDPSGTWVTGYAQIGTPKSSATEEVLGIEITADDWNRTLWGAGTGMAVYVWMFLILPLATFVSTRRQNRQRDTLRNLNEAVEQAQSAVMIVSPKQRIEYTNAGFCRQLGYSREELIGREWREFQAFEAPPEVIKDLVNRVGAGQPWSGEWTMRRKDGIVFPVRGGVTPVKDRSGVIRSFVAVFDDVTEIRETESMLREAKERAEAGDRAKGQFLATMSHEVRTPLNGIVGFASLLLDTDLTPEQQEFVATIRTSSETLIQLTGDILDYARIESGRLKLEPQPCDPRECVENALDLMANAAAEKGIELLHWVDDSVPPAIFVDVGRLRQVLVNLVSNAVKFTASGEVEVRVHSRPAPSAGTKDPNPKAVLEFSVRDTGIGIAGQNHAKIFRPFTQVDESTTRRFGGTGLGLAICKNIVELMEGSIAFTSEPGIGSTFSFTIQAPVLASEDLAPPARSLEHQRLAVVVTHPGLRHELVRLGRRLKADVYESTIDQLATHSDWSVAVVDVSETIAVELAARAVPRTGLPPEKLIGLVSIAWPPELRLALRSHFRVLLNKPPHHDSLRSLLSARASAVPFQASVHEHSPTSFDLDVLIVEDNAVNQQLVQRVVANLGCRWTAALNGRVAVEQLASKTPDLVLMDLHMPEMDGLSATKKIRAGEAGAAAQKVWIIALTADAREEQRSRTLAAGANDYLTKPVRLSELSAAFQRFLKARRSLPESRV